MTKITHSEDQRLSKATSEFMDRLKIADYHPAGLAYFSYYQGRMDEILETKAAPSNNQREGEKVFRWVKASDRLPENDGQICVMAHGVDYSAAYVRTHKDGSRVICGMGTQRSVWPNWKKILEWLEEIDAPVSQSEGLPGHRDIPADDMRKIYNAVQCWNDEFKPFVVKGMVQGYLLAAGKLPKFTYLTDAEMTELIKQHIFQDPGEKVPAAPTHTPSLPVEEVPEGHFIPEDFYTYLEDRIGSKERGAFLAGAREVLFRMQRENKMWEEAANKAIEDKDQELSFLRTQLSEAQKDRELFESRFNQQQAEILRLAKQLRLSEESREDCGGE